MNKKSEYSLSSDLVAVNLDVDFASSNPENTLLNNLREKGCAVIKNHSVPVHLLKDIFTQWGQFFASEEKFKWLRDEVTDEGYIPLHGEIASKSDEPDFKEFFQAHYQCKLPSSINTESTNQMFESLVTLGNKICSLLDIALPESVKKNMNMPLNKMVLGSKNHILRIMHYPPIEAGVHVPRSASHTDICLFTFVFGSTFKGLELQDQNGIWYAPEVEPTSVVIFNGDMLDMCTNGYLKSVAHAVKANPNSYTESRYSLPCGFHPLRGVTLTKDMTAGLALRTRLNEMKYPVEKFSFEDH